MFIMMKFKHIFMILFFAVVFQLLGAQEAVLSPEVLKKINGAVFEVVVLKPEEGKLEYEKKLTIGDAADASLSVTIKKETVRDEYQKLLSKYLKEVAMPGFRRGKVPAKIFEAKYSDAIKKELASVLLENATQEIFEKAPKGETPIACSPFICKEMSDINFDEDFSFVICYDVQPILEIKKDEPQMPMGGGMPGMM